MPPLQGSLPQVGQSVFILLLILKITRLSWEDGILQNGSIELSLGPGREG